VTIESDFVDTNSEFNCWILDFKTFVEAPELEGGMGKVFPVDNGQDFLFFVRDFLKSESGYKYADSHVHIRDYEIVFTKVTVKAKIS
jgi:hypothetical protein